MKKVKQSIENSSPKKVGTQRYARPELIEYGSIAKLTRGSGSSGGDGASSMGNGSPFGGMGMLGMPF